MAKHETLLKAFQEGINEWVCRAHNSDGANQSAATFREIKKRGYQFEEVTPNRWDKSMHCEKCKTKTTHSKLLSISPVFSEKPRINIKAQDRKRILEIFNGKDAFTGASISSTPEIDHKTPWTRLDVDIDASNMSESDIKNHFQLLTREHNLLKDRACGSCKQNNIRPPFFEIKFWYFGDENYNKSCEGCGWYDGVIWRKKLNEKIK
jgi:hypothetical protein